MSSIFDLSSFHLFAIAFVIIEAVTDSVVDCVVCIIAYPVYNHLPAVVSGSALPYIGVFLVPPKRVYRFIVILYIPVLFLWRVRHRVHVPRKLSSTDQAVGDVSSNNSDIEIYPSSSIRTSSKDDCSAAWLRRARKSLSVTNAALPRSPYKLRRVLTAVTHRNVVWRVLAMVYRPIRRVVHLAYIIPFKRIFSGEAWHYQLCVLWHVILQGRVMSSESDSSKWNRFARECYSLPEMSDALSGLDDAFRGKEERSEDRGGRRHWIGLGAKSMSYGQLVHLGDEKYQDVLKRYNNRWALYRKMPNKSISRLWGRIGHCYLPRIFRRPAFRTYIWLFGCSLEEAAVRDLVQYQNFSEFFMRRLRPGVRPVDKKYTLTSPADGTILHCGIVEGSTLEQVKGVTYSLKGFLGPREVLLAKFNGCATQNPPVKRAHFYVGDREDDTGEEDAPHVSLSNGENDDLEKDYMDRLLTNPGSHLYQCIIYLAPGDYHRFHSPTDWTVYARRHFPGELFSVNPGIARWLQGLFNFNERVVYVGRWQHGFFSMTAVGATNVGSINVTFDKGLSTNSKSAWESGSFNDASFGSSKTTSRTNKTAGEKMKKGQDFGHFNLGSTIVLLFEAPHNFKFVVQPGKKIKYGQAMGMSVTCKNIGGANGAGARRGKHQVR